jgi:hypothetical protein
VIGLIRLLIRLVFTPWGFVVLGILLMVFAWASFQVSQEALPGRAALSQAAGVLDRATKVTQGRSRGVSYDLEIRSANGFVVKLKVPERDITEEQVKSLLGRSVIALFSGAAWDSMEVWELGAGGTAVIQYEQTRQRHVETKASQAATAPYVGGGGLLASLAGILAVIHQRRRKAAAAL